MSFEKVVRSGDFGTPDSDDFLVLGDLMGLFSTREFCLFSLIALESMPMLIVFDRLKLLSFLAIVTSSATLSEASSSS